MKLKTLIVILIFCVLSLTGCSSSNKPFSKLDKTEQDSFAWVMAIDTVKQNLKAPSSAKFPSQSQGTVTSLGNNQYSVSSYVEADNSFGAKIKSYFIVKLTIDEQYNTVQKGYGYKVDECKIQ